MQVWNFFNKNKVFDWKTLSSAAVLMVQEILFACIPHLALEYRFDLFTRIVLTTEAHVPSNKSVYLLVIAAMGLKMLNHIM